MKGKLDMIKGRKVGYEKTLSFQALKEGLVRVSSLDFARDDQINNAITLRLESQKCGFISSLGLRLPSPDKKVWLEGKNARSKQEPLQTSIKTATELPSPFPKIAKSKTPIISVSLHDFSRNIK